ncbi:MAG TPA: LysR substrate-binding domain-containing protein [Ramlibacter sp.]|jgi:DNA-binding transcriptional LysR family regulator|nr:LysR substrate-binding domain-containing protein [Ramlibacter sp.]
MTSALRTLDLRRIRHFVVLAETLNYRKASQLLHMTQPPLTVSIQKLEAELGVRLFERDAKGVRLTGSGQAALDDARRILQHAEAFAEAAALAESGQAGQLRIGFTGSATHGVLQRLVPRVRAELPRLELVLREGSSMGIVQSLANGDIDAGFLWTPVLRPMGAQFQVLQRDTLVAALPAGHRLAQHARLRLADLADEAFIMYDALQAEGMRSVCMMACQRAGFVPRAAQEAIQVKTVLTLVETGLGIALVPGMMQRVPGEGVVYRPLAELADENLIGLALAHRPQPHPTVAALCALAAREFPPPDSRRESAPAQTLLDTAAARGR